LTIRTADTAEQTAFFDPDPSITPEESRQLTRQLQAAFAQGANWCVMSGSSPCDTTDRFFSELVAHAREAGVRTLVDTYGRSLTSALQSAPDVVKLNQKEWEQEKGVSLGSADTIRAALAGILRGGSAYAAITFGPRGVAAAWDDVVCAWKPPAVSVVNPIGAGDAMTAGIVDALSRGADPKTAFRWSIACAAASVEHWVACDVRRAEVESMQDRIVECSLDDLVP
jgi:fructose-1-phosphate kinase PfkB-like protein